MRLASGLPDPRYQQTGRSGHAREPRLHPPVSDDIAALFERTPLATAVHIVNEPVLAGWRDDRSISKSIRPLAEDDRDLTSLATQAIAAAMARRPLPHPTVDEALVTRLVAAQHGMPVPITVPGLVEADYPRVRDRSAISRKRPTTS